MRTFEVFAEGTGDSNSRGHSSVAEWVPLPVCYADRFWRTRGLSQPRRVAFSCFSAVLWDYHRLYG